MTQAEKKLRNAELEQNASKKHLEEFIQEKL